MSDCERQKHERAYKEGQDQAEDAGLVDDFFPDVTDHCSEFLGQLFADSLETSSSGRLRNAICFRNSTDHS